ncbi:hypothetical protein WR25_23478 [Diploscapter pachys]|uniref:Uncharacterized protein n=1 Tax=Diploscapter pachys TaxID=2018661 RepID=A0A2A2L8S6_9BILA|nr:hypothetical protein WR25_23478 [Diploscapter pachys]
MSVKDLPEGLENQADSVPWAKVKVLDKKIPTYQTAYEEMSKADDDRKILLAYDIDPSVLSQKNFDSRTIKKYLYVLLYLTTTFGLIYTLCKCGFAECMKMENEHIVLLFIVVLLQITWLLVGDSSIPMKFRDRLGDWCASCWSCDEEEEIEEIDNEYKKVPGFV